MFGPNDIKLLHVESSTKCNAWCPACDRNMNGYGINPDLIEQDLSTTKLIKALESLPNLEIIQFNGNFGDPIAGKNFLSLVDVALKHRLKIQIHTNGGLRSKNWWSRLADKLKNFNHDVWFGIDGIGKIHEIYRQGTSFNKVLENATAFIENGGHATWQFISFKHNEHQLKDCLKKSQEIGFKKFKVVKTFRRKTLAKNWKTGEEFTLSPPQKLKSLIRFDPKTVMELKKQVKLKDCMHLEVPSIFISAGGRFSTCCFKKFESFDTIDELFYNKLNLNNVICLAHCGS